MVIGKPALSCQEYLRKGRQVFVEGRLRTREWESNVARGRRTEIIAVRVQFLGTPTGGGGAQNIGPQEITAEFSDSSELNE